MCDCFLISTEPSSDVQMTKRQTFSTRTMMTRSNSASPQSDTGGDVSGRSTVSIVDTPSE